MGVEVKEAEHKFQRCNSCHAKNVACLTMSVPTSNHSQSFHLCNDCLFSLISKIREYLGC